MSLFKKEYIVSEENYKEILQKIKKTTSKFHMHELRYADKDNGKKGKKFVLSSFNICKGWSKKRQKGVMKIYNHPKYIDVSEHIFKRDYDLYKEGKKPTSPWFSHWDYERMKCLIHLDIGIDQAIVLCEGDKITFNPFGWFTISQKMFIDDRMLYFNFIPYIFKKVENAEEIISNRREREAALNEKYMNEDLDYDD